MEIRIQNLGPVEDATLTLRPLTIFAGHSNTGKTWTASTVANVFSSASLGWLEYLSEFKEQKGGDYPPIEQALVALESAGHAPIDLVTFAHEFGQTYFNAIARLAPRWLASVIGTHSALFERTQVTVDLQATPDLWLRLRYFEVHDQVGGVLRALKEKNETRLYFYVDGQVPDLRQKYQRQVFPKYR